ncbi:hypothetical protein INR49_027943, partial [Caranx melampygus]
PVPPGRLTVSDVSSESLSLQWDTPAGEVQSYVVTCCTEGETVQQLTTDTNTVTFNSLKPGVCYSLHVSTQMKNERISEPSVTTACTHVPPPSEVTVLYCGTEAISLGLMPTDCPDQYKLKIDYSCETQRCSVVREDSNTVDVEGLNPGTEYTFCITRIVENGNQSEAVSVSVCTEPVPPGRLTVPDVSTESLSLQWDTPAGEVQNYVVTCCTEGETVQELTTDTNTVTFNSLKP